MDNNQTKYEKINQITGILRSVSMGLYWVYIAFKYARWRHWTIIYFYCHKVLSFFVSYGFHTRYYIEDNIILQFPSDNNGLLSFTKVVLLPLPPFSHIILSLQIIYMGKMAKVLYHKTWRHLYNTRYVFRSYGMPTKQQWHDKFIMINNCGIIMIYHHIGRFIVIPCLSYCLRRILRVLHCPVCMSFLLIVWFPSISQKQAVDGLA